MLRLYEPVGRDARLLVESPLEREVDRRAAGREDLDDESGQQALAGEPLTVAGDGSQTRSICYVDDLVEGIVRLLTSGHPGPMNIGNPVELSVLAIARPGTIDLREGAPLPVR